MIHFGKSFRIQGENPLESAAILKASLTDVSPRAAGITKDGGRAIDFAMTEGVEASNVAEWMLARIGGEDSRSFDLLCGAGFRSEARAFSDSD